MADPKTAQFRLFDAVTRFLERTSAEAPLMVVVDDLHWADTATLQLFGYFATELTAARLLLVGTYRDTEITGRPGEEAIAAVTRASHYELLELRPLDHRAISEYMAAATEAELSSQLVEAVRRVTEGNPFFLTEVVSLMDLERSRDVSSLEVPPSVRAVLRGRLGLVSDRCRDLLTSAAVAGLDFDLPLLAAVMELDEAQVLALVEEAIGFRLIEETDQVDEYRFSHPLIQETLVVDLSASRLARLHAHIAETLELLHEDAPEPIAFELAMHFTAASPLQAFYRRKGLAYSIQAGEAAEQTSAWGEAARLYSQAETLMSDADEDQDVSQWELLRRIGVCRRLLGDAVGAGEALVRSFGLAQQHHDSGGMARAALDAIQDGVWLEASRGIAMADEALAANQDAPPKLMARLLARRAWEPFGFDGTSNTAAQRAEELAAEHGLGDVQFEIHDRETHRIMHEGRFDELVTSARAGFELADRLGNHEAASHALMEAAGGDLFRGELDAALDAAHVLLPYAQGHGVDWFVHLGRSMVAMIALLRGDDDGFETSIEEVPPDFFVSPLLAWATRAEILGDMDTALRLAVEASEVAPLESLLAFVRGMHWGTRARIELHAGDRESARVSYEAWREAVHQVPPGAYLSAALAPVDDVLVELGDQDEVRWVYENLTGHDARIAIPGRTLDVLRGQVAMALGDIEASERHHQVGLEWAEREGCDVEAGRHLLSLAEVAGLDDLTLVERHQERAAELFAKRAAAFYLRQLEAQRAVP
jgi:hypothetical protein